MRANQHGGPLTVQTAAFTDFLKTFKSSSTEAADQLEDLTLNGNGDGEDEYDMVDDSDHPAPNATPARNKSKLKYMDQLQHVANRLRDEIQIDLNDVDAVSGDKLRHRPELMGNSTNVQPPTTTTTTS